MSFKESFEKGGEKENLDYDDSAFYYFGLSMLSVVLIPSTYYFVIKPVVFGDFYIPSNTKNCQCDICKQRMDKRKALHRYSWMNMQFAINLLLICVGWYFAYQCFEIVKDIEPLKQFVPHELLGVESDATVAEVKRAYRKLSRTMHPDKNPDNPDAVTDFIQLTKAYTILTDEKARDNFLKYGNPDGKGTFAVGIALPNWLHDEQFHLQVLCMFFILVVIVVPYQFIRVINYNQSDVGGVDLETRKTMTHLIDENLDSKRIPGILQFSKEFQAMEVTSKEEFELCKKLKAHDTIKQYIPKLSSPQLPQVQVKPIVLLVGHMFGLLEEKDLKSGKIEKNLESMLKQIPTLIDVMIEQTMMLSQMFRMGRTGRRIFARNILTEIQFSQNLMTGGFMIKSPFSQLPDVGEPECERIKEKIGKKTLYNYCGGGVEGQRITKEDRLELAPHIFGHKAGSPELKRKFEQQELVIESLPIVKLTMSAEVVGEDEICVGDVLTCKLTVEVTNLDKGMRTGYVHSKHFPFLRRDNWFLIITDEQLLGLAAVEKIPLTDAIYEKEFREKIQRPGRIAFTAILTNDSYRGLDQVQKVEVQVKETPEHRETPVYCKYDLKEIRQQNAVAAALHGADETDSDEEDAKDEEDELRRKLKSAGLKTAAGTADESSSEEEDESDDDEDSKDK